MPSSAPPPSAATGPASQRWRELLDGVVGLLPAGTRSVRVDGAPVPAAIFASRLAAALTGPATEITVAPGARARDTPAGDVVIWLRTGPGGAGEGARGRDHDDSDHNSGAQGDDRQEQRQREARADIVIDRQDPDWPVIRRVNARLAADGAWYRPETRAFFARRAAAWDTKFGADLPAYTAAISAAALPRDGVVLDIGCGSGRALLPLRQAVGPGGSVIALDLTPEMLAVARAASITARAALVLADARSLPVADATADGIFAAGLVNHLPDPRAGLRELARVTRRGGLLVLFHPSGRAALAARQGRDLSPDEPLAEGMLRGSAAASGWQLTAYDDASHRFLAIAERC